MNPFSFYVAMKVATLRHDDQFMNQCLKHVRIEPTPDGGASFIATDGTILLWVRITKVFYEQWRNAMLVEDSGVPYLHPLTETEFPKYPHWRNFIPPYFENSPESRPVFAQALLKRAFSITEDFGVEWNGPMGWNIPAGAALSYWDEKLPAGVLSVCLLLMPLRPEIADKKNITSIPVTE